MIPPRTSGTGPYLILFGSDTAFLDWLKPYSAELPYIGYEAGFGPQVTARANLDAFWTTPMAAMELFGATPPFPLHKACILETPSYQREKGLPRYGVTGVAISQDDVRTPEGTLRLVISALLEAVRDFNSQNKDQISRIGILPEDLELKKIKPQVAFKIIREEYDAQASSGKG